MMTKFDASTHANDIAIIGMSGRFPGAKSVEDFWENLVQGVDSITFFSDEELLAEGVSPELLNNPDYIKAGAILEDVDQFDAAFFGLNPNEAAVMDPQQRLFLECAWEAIENGGYNCESYPGAISVFGGCGLNRYVLFNVMPNQDLIESLGEYPLVLGNDKDFLSLRVSYKLNLKGAAMNVQSACSTSLVAIHMACQNLLSGESDMALAGGVTIAVPHKVGYLQQPGITSADGHCRAFDADASGTIFGSGVGVVLLKRLEDAVADGDQIYAVIKGTAVNNDGSNKVSFTAPSVEGQVGVISEALNLSGVNPESIRYIETHGTATALGDPIEIESLTQAFRAETDKRGYCAIGSAKSNIGHLDTASGVTAVIKAALALKNQLIPPSLHYQKPNPKIDFENSPFFVNTELTEWQAGEEPRRAGVSSFGFGGTNAYAVLEESPAFERVTESKDWNLLVLSAKTPSALEAATDKLKAHLQQHPKQNLTDATYTLQVGRVPFKHRRVLAVRDAQDAVQALESRDPKRLSTGSSADSRSVAYMFSGTGSQYVNMAAELYGQEPLFQQHVDRCCELLKPHLGLDLRDLIYPQPGQEDPQTLTQTVYAQPALFVIEYAMSQLLMKWGIQPQAMIGHSLGEYVAACLAGVFSLEEALALVAKRAQLIQSLPEGGMLAVHLSEQQVRDLLSDDLSLAVVNGMFQCVVAGGKDAVDRFQKELEDKGINCARVHTVSAFHSHLVEPILAEFSALVQSFQPQQPSIPFVSNVTGTWITAEEATDPAYWERHLRQTVRFADGVRTLSQDPNHVLLEVGPGKTLSSFAKQAHTEEEMERTVLTTIRHIHDKSSDLEFFLNAVGKLWIAGVEVDWEQSHEGEIRNRVPLPTYPFERQRYWVDARPYETAVGAKPGRAFHSSDDPFRWFYSPVWKQSRPVARFIPESLAEQAYNWLIFIDEASIGAGLVRQLEQLGQQVVTVQVGSAFVKTGERAYSFDPAQVEEYELLVRHLQEAGQEPDRVVHLWTLGIDTRTEAQSGAEFFDRMQGLGFYSLMFFAKALGKQAVTKNMEFVVAGNSLLELNSSEQIVPEKSTVLGISKVIPQEYTNITCRVLDVVLPDAATRHAQLVVDQILAEMSAQADDRLIAYRGTQRFVQTFEQLAVDPVPERPTRLRERGVYLVVGGLAGFVGAQIAEYLAKSVQAKLVLTGRVAMPHREEWEQWLADHDEQDPVSVRIRKVQNLESYGAEVLVVRAEVSDEQQMRAAIEQAHQHFGALHGVVHAAGRAGQEDVKLISETQVEDSLYLFQPKVYGAFVLQKVLREQDLDFCLLLSSLSVVLGGLGCSTYAAAHSFIDAFVKQQNKEMGLPWLSYNWDDKTLDRPEEVFARAVSLDVVLPFIVSTVDLNASINKWIKFEYAHNLDDTREVEWSLAVHYTRPNLQTEYAAPTTELEETLAGFWAELLGLEKVGIHDNFFDLGGNSLLGTKLFTRLRNEFQVDLSMRTIFEASTVAELSVVIEERLIEAILAMGEDEVASS